MPQGLLAVLAGMPDPRGRHGRRYPIPSWRAVRSVATMTGHAALEDMGARAPSNRLTCQRPFPRNRRPARETFRTLLCRLDLPWGVRR